MFNFLNSAVLLAAAAALIPLLIHLFSKRKVQVVEFSSLKHLKEMQKRQVRRLKIRQLLLLILRMLIILIAVLAFARPATKGGYIGSHAGVSAVVLLDRSASMQRETNDGRLYDLAEQAAHDIVGNFGENDELILIPFDKECYFPAGERFFNRSIAVELLDDLECGYDESRIGIALDKAVRILENSKNLNRELYIITDRQYNSLPDQIDTTTKNITTFIIDLPVEIEGNNGVIGIDLGGQLIETGSPFFVHTEIQNFDNFRKTEVLASLFIDDIRVMQTELTLDAKAKSMIGFEHTVFNPGAHHGRIELSDDDYLPDNKYYFSFQIPERFNVLIIDEDGAGELMKLALVPSDKLARYWSVKTIRLEQLAEVQLRNYDALIISGLKEPDEAERNRILKFVDNGGGLFCTIGAEVNIPAFNQELSKITSIEMTKPMPVSFSGAGYYTLEQFDTRHPIFTAFDSLMSESLPTLRFFALPEYETDKTSRELAYFSNGKPGLIENSYGLGKIICLTAPLLPRYTDLTAHSFYVPFLIRTIAYLAGAVAEYEIDNYVGNKIIRNLSGIKSRYGEVTMIAPDNYEYKLSGKESSGQIAYDCQPVELPGIYRLKIGNSIVDLFPLNTGRKESDLSSVSTKRFAEAIGRPEAKTISYNTKAVSVISTARFGRELWKIFLWAVVLLIAVEMFLARESKEELETPTGK